MKKAHQLAMKAAGFKDPHKELNKEGVYEHLRMAHQHLKQIFYSDKYEEKFDHRQRTAIDVVNGALYNAEGFFTEF